LNVFRGGDLHEFLSRIDPATGLSSNEKFRAVHDYAGHGILGNKFDALGEERAYAAHSQMYSPLARMAMASETRGQNSFVNYSPLNVELEAKIADMKDEAEAATDDRTQIEAAAHGKQQDAVIPDAMDGASDVSKLGATAIPSDEPIPEDMEPAGNGDSQEATGASQTSPTGASGQPEAIDPDLLEQVRDEAFAEGRAAAEAEMHSHLTDAIAVLRAAATALMHPAPDALAGLQSEIADTVLRIASERAGLEIDSMPDAFVERITTLAERIYQATNQPVLRLNPYDHSAIAELIEGNDILSTMRIIASGELARGDIELVVDGLSIADRITPARTSHKATRSAAKPKSRAIDT
ncbi:MAG: hypothetical protein EBS68_16150, partial [Rhodobacteraceae bacterium]|nr:hypothetical protein [Paracoccaceae bacterium]